jgi:hypothetical protein
MKNRAAVAASASAMTARIEDGKDRESQCSQEDQGFEMKDEGTE